MQNMKESVRENIPALMYALSEAQNYSKHAPKRVENFQLQDISEDYITLEWDYEENTKDVYFEIYRTTKHKNACREHNLVATTKNHSFTNTELESGKTYFYAIRAVDSINHIKSAFSPKVKVRTKLSRQEFSRTIFPLSSEIGYVAEKSLEQNREHFGKNSFFVGVSEARGISYGVMDFDLSSLPKPSETIITDAYIVIQNKNNPKIKQDVRYNIEFIDVENHSYEDIKNRERIEFIGYEVSKKDLSKKSTHHFLFDSFSMLELESFHEQDRHASFIVKATISSEAKNNLVNWYPKDSENEVKLIIKYIKRRKFALAPVTNLKTSIEKGMIKLTWQNPKDEAFIGAYVVRNRFHIPRNPQDGIKLYAGNDNYTYDNYGSTKIDKYYAVFTYNDVPNNNETTTIKYKAK